MCIDMWDSADFIQGCVMVCGTVQTLSRDVYRYVGQCRLYPGMYKENNVGKCKLYTWMCIDMWDSADFIQGCVIICGTVQTCPGMCNDMWDSADFIHGCVMICGTVQTLSRDVYRYVGKCRLYPGMCIDMWDSADFIQGCVMICGTVQTLSRDV